jgi:hypothetical protein
VVDFVFIMHRLEDLDAVCQALEPDAMFKNDPFAGKPEDEIVGAKRLREGAVVVRDVTKMNSTTAIIEVIRHKGGNRGGTGSSGEGDTETEGEEKDGGEGDTETEGEEKDGGEGDKTPRLPAPVAEALARGGRARAPRQKRR